MGWGVDGGGWRVGRKGWGGGVWWVGVKVGAGGFGGFWSKNLSPVSKIACIIFNN